MAGPQCTEATAWAGTAPALKGKLNGKFLLSLADYDCPPGWAGIWAGLASGVEKEKIGPETPPGAAHRGRGTAVSGPLGPNWLFS